MDPEIENILEEGEEEIINISHFQTLEEDISIMFSLDA